MRITRFTGPAWSIAVLGLALSLLLAPQSARADDDDEKDSDQRTIRIFRNDDSKNAVQSGAFLGVQVQDVTRALRRARDLPTSEGALVNRVEEDSPASAGGLRRGDVIVELDGKKVEDAEDLIEAVRDQEPGHRVKITLWRSGSLKTVSVTLGERPKDFMMRAPGLPRARGGDDEFRFPAPPPPGSTLRRSGRADDQIEELESQLQRLRDVEIPRLENEIRALRDELRRSEERDRSRNRDRDDDDADDDRDDD